MSAEITFDTRDFNAALIEYWAQTKKDLAYVTNRQALNVAIKAYQSTPIADESKIRALDKRSWWPKFVAKTIGKRASGGRVKVGKRRFSIGGKRAAGSYTRAQARRISEGLILARLKRVRFIKAGWAPAIKILSALKMRMKASTADTRKIRRPAGDAVVAIPGATPMAMIINKSAGATKVATTALQKAFNLAAADMRQYLRDSMLPTAKKHAPLSR